MKRIFLFLAASILIVAVAVPSAVAQDSGKKPNILVIWGDDIGTMERQPQQPWYDGLPKRRTSIASLDEGLSFTDYYGQQSCTAGRAAFRRRQCARANRHDQSRPAGSEGRVGKKSDVTDGCRLERARATPPASSARTTSGRPRRASADQCMDSTNSSATSITSTPRRNRRTATTRRDHGPAQRQDVSRSNTVPRGVMKCKVNPDGKGAKTIVNTGALDKEANGDHRRPDRSRRPRTSSSASIVAAGKPFFCWWNGTRMHFPHPCERRNSPASAARRGNEYHDGMVEHDRCTSANCSTSWTSSASPRTRSSTIRPTTARTTTPGPMRAPRRSAARRTANWEGAYRVPAFVRWPGHFPAGKTLNGIVSHEDWLPTFAAAAGNPDIKDQLKKGVDLNGRHYRNYIDGYNMIDYLSGNTEQSPRKEFFYVNDDGQIVAIRLGDWKAVFLENRGKAFEVWREPFTELRIPLLFNLRRDPFEKAQHNATTYNDWFLDHAFVIVPMQQLCGKFLATMKDYPPSQTPGSFNLDKIQKQIEAAGTGK